MANWQSTSVLIPQLIGLLAQDGFTSKQLFSLPALQQFTSRDTKSFNAIEILKILECQYLDKVTLAFVEVAEAIFVIVFGVTPKHTS